jgi:hypothetical protein
MRLKFLGPFRHGGSRLKTVRFRLPGGLFLRFAFGAKNSRYGHFLIRKTG